MVLENITSYYFILTTIQLGGQYFPNNKTEVPEKVTPSVSSGVCVIPGFVCYTWSLLP
jgi:hypothetical protein